MQDETYINFGMSHVSNCSIGEIIKDNLRMKFILDFFVLITGIGAASGLHYNNDNLFIVSDNSNYLYEYHMGPRTLVRHLLLNMDGKNEQVDKEKKMDLEAITYHKGAYHLLPSGSETNRAWLFDIEPQKSPNIGKKDGSELYARVRDILKIPTEDFNIEGALFHQDTLLLFNRGNGPHKINGIISIFPKETGRLPAFTPVKLPDINGKPAGFTDASLVGGKIYFLATAESGNSSYHDGEIGGSQIGVINLTNLALEKTETISLEHKFEGITLYKSTKKAHVFLLCEDPDNGETKSAIYRLKIRKQK